jgi:hypothetical protein
MRKRDGDVHWLRPGRVLAGERVRLVADRGEQEEQLREWSAPHDERYGRAILGDGRIRDRDQPRFLRIVVRRELAHQRAAIVARFVLA